MTDDKHDFRTSVLAGIEDPMEAMKRQSEEITEMIRKGQAEKQSEERAFFEKTLRKVVREETKPLLDVLTEIRDILGNKKA